MKKTLALVAISAAALLSSCAMAGLSTAGFVYGDVAAPTMDPTTNGGTRKGTSQATSYLGGIVAIGDASLAAAKAQGGLSTVSTVDTHRKNILGIITTYTTIVTGH